MEKSSSLLFLFFFIIIPGVSSPPTTEPHYLILVPFLIHTETPEKICVQMSHVYEPVMLSITLEYGEETRSLIRQIISEQEVFQCIQFQLPKWSRVSEAFLTVDVRGQTHQFRNRKTVLVKNPESLVFVQTDKPLYKPAQKVQFRIISLNEGFHPFNEKIPLVYIEDPKRNRLIQWQDVELKGGLSQLSFPLAQEPAEGTYKVVVQKASGENVEHTFIVEEYVLPKFEVFVEVPKKITILAKELEITICGMYTYGKPVPGLVDIHVCRAYSSPFMFIPSENQCSEEEDSICLEFSGEADGHGCFSQTVKVGPFQLKQPGYDMSIKIEGKITEEGTGVQLTGKGSTRITSTLSKVIFEKVDTYYKPGIPFSGQVKLVDATDTPIVNGTIQITKDVYGHSVSYITDDQGQAQFSINTTDSTGGPLMLHAQSKFEIPCIKHAWIIPFHEPAYHAASPFYSPSQSYVHIESILGTLSCGHTQPVKVHYILNPVVMKEKTVFHYLVVSKGNIVQEGTYNLPFRSREAKGVFLLNLSVTIESAPLARLLVYTVLRSGEVVAHSTDFTIENCFLNKVKLHFSDPEGLPSSNTHLHLAASRGSLCAIHAVDKSVFLLKPEAELSLETVYNLLPVKNLKGYQFGDHNLDDPNPHPCVQPPNFINNPFASQPIPFADPFNGGDTYKVFKDIGLKVFTSTKIHKPEFCQLPPGHPVPQMGILVGPPMASSPSVSLGISPGVIPRIPMGGMGAAFPSRNVLPHPSTSGDDEPTETIRKIFPETWMWFTTTLDSSENEVDIPVTIPDTITEWKAGAFCTSAETGFGLSRSAFLKAFQPFFLEPTLPYSTVQGEMFTLKTTVFSYLKHCLRVSISLEPSPDFNAFPIEKEEQSYCLCPNERKTVSWAVTPKSLGELNFTLTAEAVNLNESCGKKLAEVLTGGRKDTVTRSLLVEPEGIEKDVVFNSLLCASKGSQSEPISLKLPENVVEGSVRAHFCVVGDFLSTAIQNLHQLLRMPYGCGEQNVALFAPNIYVLDYLNKTGQLTEEIKSKATGYLVAGYQRQLNYKHSDGSYSSFGERNNDTGDAWLTAFVLKSFAQARHHIFVEQRHITDAFTLLAQRQKTNGCFQGTGRLLNNAIKGGVDDEVTLSAYITIALLEIPLPVTHTVVRNALLCLETAAKAEELHVYTQAMLAYVFSLAGREDKRKQMLDILGTKAVKEEDGSIHWRRPRRAQETISFPFYRPRASSAEVEITAYALLAYLSKRPAPAQEDLTTATHIIKWLSGQQNPTGGFASTQDTVVALQALSLYGSLTYTERKIGTKVTLNSGRDVLAEYFVDSTNHLLLQCETLPNVPGDYQAEVTGEGCTYVQTTLKYNVQTRQEKAPFALDVYTIPEDCTEREAHRTFAVAVNVSYTGQRPVSNMVIIDIKMLSGFIPVKPSVKKLEKNDQVQRTEVSTNHVLLYLEQMSSVTQSYSFQVEQDVPVQDLKPALVKVYDFYETDESAVAEYGTPCSAAESELKNA